MPNLSDQLASAMTDHEIDLLRVASHANRNVQALLAQLEDDIAGRLARSQLSAFARARLLIVQRDVQALIAEGYGAIDAVMSQQLSGLAVTEAAVLASVVNTSVGVSIMDGLLPRATLRELMTGKIIQGAPSSQWWARQAQDLTFKFAQQVRLGMAQGETNDELVRRVRAIDGLFEQPRRAAEALVRTSVQTVAGAARVAAMKENSDVLRGWQQVSTLDDRTTEVCIAYDLQTWDLDGNPLDDTTLPFVNEGGSEDGCPRHWGCRSGLVPLVKSWADLIGVDVEELEPSVRASMDGEVAAKTTYSDWLRGKSEAQQDDALGAGKAALWRSGKITVTDLLDQRGRPLTLAEIQAKHGVTAP